MLTRRERDQQWAVFWCSLLAPLLQGEIPLEEAGLFLRQLAEQECEFPDGRRRRPARATLWRKWKRWRTGGFDSLLRAARKDRGKPRRAKPEVVTRAIGIKKDQARRSHVPINKMLKHEFQTEIPRSTLYRHLKQAGATRRKLGIDQEKVRRRWTRDSSNDLWVGDFEDGPYVIQGGQAIPTHLSAWIDCHSRFVVEARYYLRENLDILIDSLLRAWSVHGASRELYVDNAKIYHANALKSACAALNIRLLHRPVRDAPAGGLIERFFKTTQDQFEAEVSAGWILTLDRLNEAFTAWRHVSYHEQPHSEIRQPPRERYEQGRTLIRQVDLDRIIKYFLRGVTRTVDPTFSDVRLNSLYFRVDPRLRGDKVAVRYDPFQPLEIVYLYTAHDEYLGVGHRHDRTTPGEPVPPPPTSGLVKFDYLQLLIDQHNESLRQRSQGIDYSTALDRSRRGWPFLDFIQQLAQHLGRAGGLSGFRSDELQLLQTAHTRLNGLNPELVRTACERASQRTIPELVFLFQQLHDEGGS